MISLEVLIYHEFYLRLAMIYRCFRNYLLYIGVFLAHLQVHECFGEK